MGARTDDQPKGPTKFGQFKKEDGKSGIGFLSTIFYLGRFCHKPDHNDEKLSVAEAGQKDHAFLLATGVSAFACAGDTF
ncbi:hypothetical protein [Beijerinckia mobilis]|uniref:hypothetical protein n=1 Tax=Beijerinckia mobilis TaxID=231434 RepID=UPI000552AD84|nr:hypothetical protein [Beijerinckia mobilis]